MLKKIVDKEVHISICYGVTPYS